MPDYRSKTTTAGRNMAGARALWRATGMKDEDFQKPIIAVVNSFTQFVPGHVHLKDLGQLVAREIEAAGGVAKEFNTIAVDDGIAMGHDGMLYSLPSRDIISDSVEYMVNAHCADAMVCISNCDKITPGMLNAAMRLNIPAVFVSGGPMEAGKTKLSEHKLDLVEPLFSLSFLPFPSFPTSLFFSSFPFLYLSFSIYFFPSLTFLSPFLPSSNFLCLFPHLPYLTSLHPPFPPLPY